MPIRINGEIHSSKNSRQIYKNARGTYVAKSKAAQADESMLAAELLINKEQWIRETENMEYPLYVVFVFHRKTKMRWDFANLVQGVADAMVKAGYLPDDDVKYFIPVFGGWDVDYEKPGVTIWIKHAHKI